MLRQVRSRIPVSYEEHLLNDCHQIYTEANEGLIAIGQSVGVTLLPPQKKITVMLIGNNSAGKSSFINWYVEEQILSNRQGFTFVTSGRKRASLTSKETFRLYPHFKPIQKVKGVSKYVGTEICTSWQKHFSLVTFVDTPGLVDGDMKYPFDVDQAILQLGEVCDLILVFFDPMGQTLCKHTLNIVKQLTERQGDRLRFYLSKADEAKGESHRQCVKIQIVEELLKWPGLHRDGYDVPTIYIPNPYKPSQGVNQIERVCHTIEKTIKQTVGNTQTKLDKDCELICKAIVDTLNDDGQCCQEKWKTRYMSCVLSLMGFGVLLLFMLMLAFIYSEVIELAPGVYGIEILLLYLGPVMTAFDSVPVQAQLIACGFLMQLSIILHILAFIIFLSKPTLSEKQKRQLQENLESVQQVVKTKKETPSPRFVVPPPPPPPIPLPQDGRPSSFKSLPGPEVRSRNPDQGKFQLQHKCQTLTSIPVEGRVLEKLNNERPLQNTTIDLMTELKLKTKLLKRQVSDGAIQDVRKQVEQQNELRKQMNDLVPELMKKDTTPPKMDLITELKERQLKRQATQ